MSDEFDNDNEDDVDLDDTPEAAAEDLKGLRRAAKDGTKARTENAQLKRELAMLKAGVDTESPVGKMFARAYEGDATPEAIKAEWATIAPIPNETTPTVTDIPDPDLGDDEMASTAQRSALASNAPADVPPVKTGREVALEAAEAVYGQGGSRDTALATVFAGLTSAAADGDASVIVKQWD